MSNPPNEPAHFVTCPCQHCSGKIEFDANQLDEAENTIMPCPHTIVPCPHCGLETILFVPPSIVSSRPPTNKTASISSANILPLTAIALWAITGVLFLIRLSLSHSDSAVSIVSSIMFIFLIAAAIVTGKYKKRKNLLNPPNQNNASPRTAIVLWGTTGWLFIAGMSLALSDSDAGDIFFLMICFLIAAGIVTAKYYGQKHPIKPPEPPTKTPITPIIPKGLQCPFCHSYGEFLPQRVMTTEGWVTMIIGILLTPVCIGIVLFFVALSFKEQKYFCCNCKKQF